MVAAQSNAIAREADAIGNVPDECSEIHGRHSRVAAVLVHLVRRRLDQRKRRVVRLGVAKRSLNHQRVRGADGCDADTLARFVPGDEVADDLHACSLALQSLY